MRKTVVKKNTNFWIGTEVEGRLKGIKTLFIVGDQKIKDIVKRINKCKVSHLYFGAGNQSKVTDFKTIKFFLDSDMLVSYECLINSFKYIPKGLVNRRNFNLILSFKCRESLQIKDTDNFKIEDKSHVYMSSKENFYKTNKLFDYLGDKFI